MLRLLELSVGGVLGPEAVCIERRHVCIFPEYHCQHCHPPPLKQSLTGLELTNWAKLADWSALSQLRLLPQHWRTYHHYVQDL